jgi:hypothetical protein
MKLSIAKYLNTPVEETMHIKSRIVLILIVVLVMGSFLAVAPKIVSAALQESPTLPPSVAPEPYPNSDIYPAKVYLENAADIQVLYQMDIDIGGLQRVEGVYPAQVEVFQPSIATIYITSAQSERLIEAGLKPVPIQNLGYRSFLAYGPGSGAPNAWPTFAEYVARMENLVNTHPDIAKLVQIGTSVQGRGLYCMEISDNPGIDENEPEFKYTANHHGDETTGVEMTMRLAELLANNYGIDPVATNIVNNMETWLCPIYNPDGYSNGTRYNAHGVDLNRDFPDRFHDPNDDPTGREPETQAFMNFGYAHRFVMGANYHGGEQVLNYPFDAVANPYPIYAPDDQLFYDFGIGYTSRNPDLWNNSEFEHGITRGWEWYMIYGGMQDWAYFYHDEHHVTLEISVNKSPDYGLMDSFWEHNREAMLWWMQRAMTGIGGVVLDAQTNAPLEATLTLVDRDMPNTVLTDPEVGDYHRVISEGDYELKAEAECYFSEIAQVSAISGTLTTQDFMLEQWTSDKTVSTNQALPGEEIEYQLHLRNACNLLPAIITDTLPGEVSWTGYLTATEGTVGYEAGQIFWQGDISENIPVTITYGVSLNQCLPGGVDIVNLAEISAGVSNPITRTAQVSVENAPPSIPFGPEPGDGEMELPITTTLTWSASTDLNCDSISYSLFFGTVNPPTTPVELSAPAYDPGQLEEGTTYYWYVVANDGLTEVSGPVWRFTTVNEPPSELNVIFLPMTRK